jgi:hypothetical protein
LAQQFKAVKVVPEQYRAFKQREFQQVVVVRQLLFAEGALVVSLVLLLGLVLYLILVLAAGVVVALTLLIWFLVLEAVRVVT